MLTKSIPHAFQATKRFRVTESDFEFEQLMTFTGAWVNKMKPRRFIKVGNRLSFLNYLTYFALMALKTKSCRPSGRAK